jgi:hypothetical protein
MIEEYNMSFKYKQQVVGDPEAKAEMYAALRQNSKTLKL